MNCFSLDRQGYDVRADSLDVPGVIRGQAPPLGELRRWRKATPSTLLTTMATAWPVAPGEVPTAAMAPGAVARRRGTRRHCSRDRRC